MPSIAITQPYEAVYIVDPSLGDEQIGTIKAKYQGIVETGGGVVENIDVWERRRLAYEIKGRTEGIYVIMQFQSKPDVEAELRRIFQISEDQIRYMIVRRDDEDGATPIMNGMPARQQSAQQPQQLAPVAAPAPQPVVVAAPVEMPVEEASVGEPAPVAETPSAETPSAAEATTEIATPAEASEPLEAAA